MVECLTRYQWVVGSSLTWSTALCSWTWHQISCAQYWFAPDEVGGILFWRRPSVHPSVCLSVCLSTCPSRNIPKYLLVRFDAFFAWMDSTMDSPKCGTRGGGRGSGPPLKNHKLHIFYRNKQLEPPTPEKVGTPPPPPPPRKYWTPSGTLKNDSFLWN